jgi:hypothetical protein
MNTKTKKTIAKEIIYFFSVLALLLLVFVGIELRNSFLNNKINYFSKEISVVEIEIDSIQKTNPEKVNKKPKFDEYGILMKNADYYNVLDNTMQLKKTDKEKLDNIMLEMQNNNESDENKKFVVNDFVKKYGINKSLKPNQIFEELKKNKTETNQKIKVVENKILNINETKNIIIRLSLLLFGLLYPIRLIYKLLKWSFLTIQTKV